MWFDSWSDLLRIVAVGAAAYVTLVVVLRVSGKRTLAQLNAYDFVVTVALGSTLATILLSADVSWSEGAVAFALIAVLQFVVAWTSSRWPRVRGAVTSRPVLLLRDGEVQREALRRARLTDAEIAQAVRGTGAGDLRDIRAIVLETNGKLSVIPASAYGDGSALRDVSGA
ncbi:DUF421 domain-containing protein [Microbacterium sp. LRZ72]|uniref:DUF421 domain-containing protein n=1 Tax=Microbacterium sp. LRZ72 TaxID=2942481 RepID=UPI0029BB461C|nr:YetF domain-containing protein [Microbacterium sp. LRZ72]MDX2377980.1 DUF421 domain-containing protein [Microbacterium sp. LRZ72]